MSRDSGADPRDRAAPPDPGLCVDVRLERGGFALRAAFEAGPGITALFGPSGAGKTTLLRIVAGLEPGAGGRVAVDGEAWLSPGERRGRPPHRRQVGYVFQDAKLLPHLSVEGNLAYARRRGSGDGPGVADVVSWLGLGSLLSRSPERLSGGERQRVALGRALVRGPRVLLLDEPLSSLDRPARHELLDVLEALPLRHPVPILLVSHDLEEVVRLAPEMVWLDAGRVRAAGPTHELLARPDFVRWRGDDAGVAAPGTVMRHESDGLTVVSGPWGDLVVPGPVGHPGRTVRLRILARDVSLALDREEQSSLMNQFPLHVTRVDELSAGERLVRLVARDGGDALLARVTTRSARRLGLAEGRRVWARVKSVAVLGA